MAVNPASAKCLDPVERALDKARSRAADGHALASARISVAELRAQNEAFVGQDAPARIDLAAARALA
jgi:hypothetical protein